MMQRGRTSSFSPALAIALLWTLLGGALAAWLARDWTITLIGLLLGAGTGLVGWAAGTAAGGVAIGAVGASWGVAAALGGSLIGRAPLLAVVGTTAGLLTGGLIWSMGRGIAGIAGRGAGIFFRATASGMATGTALGAIYGGITATAALAADLQRAGDAGAPALAGIPLFFTLIGRTVGDLLTGVVFGGAAGFLAGVLAWIVVLTAISVREP